MMIRSSALRRIRPRRDTVPTATTRRTFVFSSRQAKTDHHGRTYNDQSYQRTKNFYSHKDDGLKFTSTLSFPRDVEGPEGLPSRSEMVERLGLSCDEGEEYDVLVIGGGATGAGCALDAGTRGNLKVACIERGDFSSETSSRSTKLIWAGIKYMASATSALLSRKLLTDPSGTAEAFLREMKMVLNCHRERRYMMEKQGHLCQWIGITIPFDHWHISPPPFGHPLFGFFPVLAPFVLKAYDAMSYFSCPPSYVMTPTQAKQAFPQLETRNLKYCAVFYEGQHNDARTNLAIALTAAQRGVDICNYVEMTDTIKHNDGSGRVVGVKAVDRITGQEIEIRAKKIIFCGGPFTDDLRKMEDSTSRPTVRGAAGSHIVLPQETGCPTNLGLLDYNTSDGRFLFMLPWQGHTLVGTTDQKGRAHTLPLAPKQEVDWLLGEGSKYLKTPLRRSDVLSSWRGWRPLAVDPHADGNGQVSRDHVISENPQTGIVFIAGGKWTTWREMAEEVVDRVIGDSSKDSLKCKTLDITLYGGEGYSKGLANNLMQRYENLPQDVAEHLARTYGGRAWEVCKPSATTANGSRSFARLAPSPYPYIVAEVIFACREYACTIEDVLSRRTRLAFLNQQAALEAIQVVADTMAAELHWTTEVKAKQMEAARAYTESYSTAESTATTHVPVKAKHSGTTTAEDQTPLVGIQPLLSRKHTTKDISRLPSTLSQHKVDKSVSHQAGMRQM